MIQHRRRGVEEQSGMSNYWGSYGKLLDLHVFLQSSNSCYTSCQCTGISATSTTNGHALSAFETSFQWRPKRVIGIIAVVFGWNLLSMCPLKSTDRVVRCKSVKSQCYLHCIFFMWACWWVRLIRSEILGAHSSRPKSRFLEADEMLQHDSISPSHSWPHQNFQRALLHCNPCQLDTQVIGEMKCCTNVASRET